jgi:hypothetical protein
MRVCSLVLALVLASGSMAFAQNKGSGFRIGINRSDIKLDPDNEGVDIDPRTAIVGGIFYTFPVAPHWSIQPEWLYSQKRSEIQDPEESSGRIKNDLDYFDVPVLVRWDSAVAGDTTFNVFGGPSFNFRHRSRQEFPNGPDVDIQDRIETFDFGIVFGAGFEIRRFILDGRYQIGLTNINKDAEEEGIEFKHRTWSFSAGFKF